MNNITKKELFDLLNNLPFHAEEGYYEISTVYGFFDLTCATLDDLVEVIFKLPIEQRINLINEIRLKQL